MTTTKEDLKAALKEQIFPTKNEGISLLQGRKKTM
jgi:hypothetical protein